MINVTHSDPDGVICHYLLLKKFGDKFKLYFSNPRNINKDILEIIKNNDKEEEIFITDIAVNQELIFLSSYFKKVYIIDHHKIDNLELTSRVNLYIKPYKSAARVVSEYFKINSNILDIIDDIDSGNIRNEIENDFKDLFVAIRYYHPKDYNIYFMNIAKDLYIKEDINYVIEKNKDIIKKFRKEIEKEINNIYEYSTIIYQNNIKVLIIRTKLNIPSNYFLDKIKEIFGNIDFVITLYENSKRGEIRTLNNRNVLDLAKFLGGGGHEYAAGFSYIDENKLIDNIKIFLNSFYN